MNYPSTCIVLERVCSFYTGAIMKKFAGVDFDLYDIEALTPAEMNNIKTQFLKHHNYMSTYAAQCEKGSKIIEHMNNYFCLWK